MKRNRSYSTISKSMTLYLAIAGTIVSVIGLATAFGIGLEDLSSLLWGILASIIAVFAVYTIARLHQSLRGANTVFISYSHGDAEFVMRLMSDLRAMGLRPIVDRLELKVGDDIKTAVDHMIDKSDYFIFVVSEKSATSIWAQKELEQAISRKKKILPIVLNPQKLPEPLAGVFYADFSQDYEKGLDQLNSTLKRNG